ncbi:MAG TPA: TlpA disulfide reductase family protein [Opitutaceae bacterium]|jgi:thiol-disulfide isomerase/thioredoxin
MKSAFLLATLLSLTLASPLGAVPIKPVPAPAWKLKDLDGKVVSSDDFKGKVVVLDFWATWCVPCRGEIPGYIAMQKKYGPEGLVFVGVSVDEEGPEVVRKFVKTHGINYPIVMFNEDILNAFAPIEGYPTTFIIDRDGNIVDKKIGAKPTEFYEKEILAVLHPKPD